MSNVKRAAFKDVTVAWWSFFWRAAIFQSILLFAGGYIITLLGRAGVDKSHLHKGVYVFCLLVVVLVSFFVFKLILGGKPKKSGHVIVPASAIKNNADISNYKPGIFRVILTWWSFFWRYAIIVFGLGVAVTALASVIAPVFEINFLMLVKYLRHVILLMAVPASFIVFMLLMWRKEKRRTLAVVRI